MALVPLLLASWIVPGCAPGDSPQAPGADATAAPGPPSAAPLLLPAIRNARIPIDGVLSGGQPTPEQLEALAALGFRHVINLRAAGETGFEWEPQLTESLGMRYTQIGIAGTDDLNPEMVRRIDAALTAARAEGPTLLHCGSGNRIGAVLALGEAWLRDRPAEEALAFGRAGGLTRLEPAVREKLELAAAAEAR